MIQHTLLNNLTNRERKVLHLISLEASYGEASKLLSMSKRDVRRLLQKVSRRYSRLQSYLGHPSQLPTMAETAEPDDSQSLA